MLIMQSYPGLKRYVAFVPSLLRQAHVLLHYYQWLKTLKAYLEELPCRKVSQSIIEDTEEIPAGFEGLEFAPPTNFQIAGSYLLRSITRPNLNVGSC